MGNQRFERVKGMKNEITKKHFYKFTSVFLTVLLLVSAVGLSMFVSADESGTENEQTGLYDSNTYNDYVLKHSDIPFANKEYTVNSGNIISSSGAIEEFSSNDIKAVILNDNNEWVEYSFNVEESALYNISIMYYPIKGTGRDIELSFAFDGSIPYEELSDVSFSRIWINETEVLTDEEGNELRPSQVESPRWVKKWISSNTGMFSDPYSVYLTAGAHTLKVSKILENVAISSFLFSKCPEAPDYSEYLGGIDNQDKNNNNFYEIEAESAFEKSDSKLAPTIDSTNANMSPVSYSERIVNSFGKDCWNSQGQWASWKVSDDLKPGLYKLSFRVKQNTSVGVASFRTLYINNVIPFKQVESIEFPYNNEWYNKTIGDEEPYLFYLQPGDIITLEATTGKMADALNKIYSSVDELNYVYQSIISVTGTEPDNERDYNINKEIPTIIDDFKHLKDNISSIDASLTKILGSTNSKTYFFKQFEKILDGYISNYRTIVPDLSTFKSYIDSYVAQTYEFNNLQLEIDTIYISGKNHTLPKPEAGFIKSLKFEMNRFLYSFANDYYSKKAPEKEITVWTSLGRDQAQAVKQIINNDFESKNGIKVNFKMSATNLSEAILSGLEPDVSLSVTQEVPIDLALRGQVLDLSEYLNQSDDNYLSQFNESAWTPFKYKGGIYAVPVTMDYNMMFCRTDVLKRMGLAVPDTWEEFYEVLRELQMNNYQVGMKEADSANAGVSTAINVFDMFLFQRGGKYFSDDLTQTDFENKESKEAFIDWVKLYRDFDLDTDINLLSRFRSGETPIIISAYNFYQTVAATALEIQGRWQMFPVPGTPKEDGSVDRSVSSTLTASIVLKGAQKRGVADEAFNFVKWWTGSDAQVKYSNAMETIQGIAGRVNTANRAAFEQIGWTKSEREVLNYQNNWVKSIEQIPGTYIINRSLTNALRTSYASQNIDPLRQLSIQNRIINEELTRKRAEFEKNN